MEVAVFRGGGLAGLVRRIAVNEESLTARAGERAPREARRAGGTERAHEE
jgi:hypothetical protein